MNSRSAMSTVFLLSMFIPISFSYFGVAMTATRIVCLVYVLLQISNFPKIKNELTLTDILIALYLLWIPISLLTNNAEGILQYSTSLAIDFGGAYLLARKSIRTDADLIEFSKILTTIVALTAPLAVYESLTGSAPLLILFDKLGMSNILETTNPDFRYDLVRARVAFLNPIHYGFVCAIAAVISLLTKESTSRLIWTTKTFLIFVSAVASISSSALIAILMAYALFAWRKVLSSTKYRWWILIGLSTVVYIAIDLASNRTPIRIAMSYLTFSSHTAYYRASIFEWGMQNVWSNPVFGLGTRDWERPEWMASSTIDNFWLVVAMKFGTPAFLFIAGAVASELLAKRAYKNREVVPEDTRFVWVVAVFAAIFIGYSVHLWSVVYSFFAFLIGAGSWKKTIVEKKSKSNQETKNPNYSRFHYSNSEPSQSTQQPLAKDRRKVPS